MSQDHIPLIEIHRDDSEYGYDDNDDDTTIVTEYEDDRPAISSFVLIASTCGLGGLQVVWSVLQSHGTPYLTSMGLPKSVASLVWVVGLLSGIVVQPWVGILSDRSRSSWGRRRPFILGGAIGTVSSLNFLAWLQNIMELSIKPLHRHTDENTQRTAITLFAVLSVCFINVSIQPLQMGLRSLIIEKCSVSQQEQASAWSSRMTGVGNIIGFLAGITDLSRLLGLRYITQFQCLSLVASGSLIVGISMSCIAIAEKNPNIALPQEEGFSGLVPYVKRLLQTYRTMPWKIRRVCHIQFFAWGYWFPTLFYSSTYIAELYSRSFISQHNITAVHHSKGKIHERGVRMGSFASLIFSTIGLFANTFLLYVIKNTSRGFRNGEDRGVSSPRYQLVQPTMEQAWTVSHLFFAILVFSTVFVTSATWGIIIIGCLGLSWALTLCAPYFFVGVEIASLRASRDTYSEESFRTASSCDAGAILSLHIIAIAAPQILAALACGGVFWLAQFLGSSDATGWTLRVGGLAALEAAWLSRTLSRGL